MKRLLILVLLAGMLLGIPCRAATNAASEQIEINAQVNFGLSLTVSDLLLDYEEPNSTTALFRGASTVVVPQNTSNQQIVLSTLFPGFNSYICFGIQDISNPGQAINFGLTSGGARIPMAAGGFSLQRVSGSVPTIFVDNTSVTTPAILRVFAIGN